MDEWLRVNEYDGVCTAWVLVSYLASIDGEDELSSYPIAMMGGSVPFHVSVGLLTTVLDIVRGIGRWIRTDDDG